MRSWPALPSHNHVHVLMIRKTNNVFLRHFVRLFPSNIDTEQVPWCKEYRYALLGLKTNTPLPCLAWLIQPGSERRARAVRSVVGEPSGFRY